ncbi:MAG: hypothetical protein BWK75_06065 [Candidatus Altiarchaeales archaeon A3]|nr:MAG: hypothetical protein BWK75_06065 [Candidatus Altiarchaeales archaeon A3]
MNSNERNPSIFAVMPIGKSTRIKDKAFVKFNGKFLFLDGYEILRENFPTFIVCHPDVEEKIHEILNVKKDEHILTDILNIGPLGALYLAAKNLTCDYIFFVGCDMPFLNSEIIKFMCRQIDVGKGVVLKREKFEPLHAIYERKFVIDVFGKAAANNGWKISKIIEENPDKFNVIDVNENNELKKIDKEIKFLNDIDTVEDLNKFDI